MPIFALIDCNNFYASCERIFNPKLADKPIIVLSNNDGCVVARSNQAKALNISMGVPYFKVKDICFKHNVEVFSSNYEFYGDMSARVMKSLSLFSPDIEIYSVDEAFLRFDKLKFVKNYDQYGYEIQTKIQQWLGLPVSIGIAHTKTLAKIANHLAKKQIGKGVVDFTKLSQLELNNILKKFNIEDIWGIGSKIAQKLNYIGIRNAYEFSQLQSSYVRKNLTVTGQRTHSEIKQVSCLDLAEIESKKNIISSGSFGEEITDFTDLSAAVSNFTVRAANKMRKQNSKVKAIYIYVASNRFRNQQKRYYASQIHYFSQYTDDITLILTGAKIALKKIFRKNIRYKKAGIILIDLASNQHVNLDLFLPKSNEKKDVLMQVYDKVNDLLGKNTLNFASQLTSNKWKKQSNYKSRRYTTNWNEILQVR